MRINSSGRVSVLILGLAIPLLLPGVRGADPESKGALAKDRVVAGGAKDYLEVHHIVLRGKNEDIGRALADIARNRHGVQPLPSTNAMVSRTQRRYLAKHYPIYVERMKGVAASYGKHLDDDSLNFSVLPYAQVRASCSVMYFPPSFTELGTGIVSRYYDFTTGTLRGTRPPPGQLGDTARPYIVELHPDRGYSSLSLCAYDMLGGVLDGVNSEGLTVALLADDELYAKHRMEPTEGIGVGIGSLQILRFLLDTCATVEEAEEALLLTKQYYEIISVHYLIADRHGKAFVWEYSQAHNREYIVENPGVPLVTTNFSLHSHLNKNRPPSAEMAKAICPRYCALTKKIDAQQGKLTVDQLKENHRVAAQTMPDNPKSIRPANRTLWHSIYFPDERKMQVSFFLHDEPDAEHPNRPKIIRSDYLDFSLGERQASVIQGR
jgi:hypothetical protein